MNKEMYIQETIEIPLSDIKEIKDVLEYADEHSDNPLMEIEKIIHSWLQVPVDNSDDVMNVHSLIRSILFKNKIEISEYQERDRGSTFYITRLDYDRLLELIEILECHILYSNEDMHYIEVIKVRGNG